LNPAPEADSGAGWMEDRRPAACLIPAEGGVWFEVGMPEGVETAKLFAIFTFSSLKPARPKQPVQAFFCVF